MRIAVWYNLPSGGGKRALHDQVRGLLARGHSVEVWCPPMADRDYLPLSELVAEHVVPLELDAPKTWDDYRRLRSYMERRVRAMDAHCGECLAQIGRGGFDLVFATGCQVFGVTSIGRLAELPAALYLQEPMRRLYEAAPRLFWLAPPPSEAGPLSPRRWRAALADWRQLAIPRIQARAEVDNAAGFDRILVNSYFSRESLWRAYGIDSEVCYLGTDAGLFADHGLPREDFVVGLGSFTPAKNAALAIEAVARIAAPRPRLVWIANFAVPDYLVAMRALAAGLGVELDVRTRVDDAVLVDLLNRATALVYAPRLEPFGFAPIEAGACATPVVAVAEGGVRETVVHGVTGLLVPHDAGALGAAIGQLRSDPALARRLGQAGRDRALRDWSQQAAIDRLEAALLRTARR